MFSKAQSLRGPQSLQDVPVICQLLSGFLVPFSPWYGPEYLLHSSQLHPRRLPSMHRSQKKNHSPSPALVSQVLGHQACVSTPVLARL